MKKNSGEVKKIMTPNNRKELAEWLVQYHLNPREIYQNSTDAHLVAKLIKKLFPKLVEMNLYPERNTMKLKLENWNKLNTKVLSKLNLTQKPADLQKFVNADKDALDYLFFTLMRAHEISEKEVKDAAGDADEGYIERQPLLVNLERLTDGVLTKSEQKMINFKVYEASIQEQMRLERALNDAQKKIKELEFEVQNKSETIDELCSDIAKQTIKVMESQEIQANPESLS